MMMARVAMSVAAAFVCCVLSAADGPAPCGRPEFDCSFPGGNVQVLGYDADSGVATIDSDFRDSMTDWFWTYFRVRGAAGRKVHFKFRPRRPNRRMRISHTGMAYSTDEGKTWRWTSPDGRHADPFSFSFEFPQDADSVRFATSIPYLRSNLDEFCSSHPGVRLSTLTRSRKGRDVPLLSVGSGETAKWSFIFTARHHASEVTASWVMEGMAEAAAADTKTGRWLRGNVHCLFVPFMDADGCEDGDPGKNRAPHDHNRDYRARIYPEVRAFQDLVRGETRRRKIVYFDMHAPQVRGSDAHPRHDNVFTMGPPPAMEKFWNDYRRRLVEATRSNALKYLGRWDEPWMTDFNVPAKNPDEQKSHDWVLEQTNVLWTATFEFGYGLCGGVVSREGLRELGRAMMDVLAGSMALPAGAGTCAEPAPLRMLTFNIYSDWRSPDDGVAARADGLEKTLMKLRPDVAALQEVSAFWWSSPVFARLETAYGVVRGDLEDALRRAGPPPPPRPGKKAPAPANYVPLLYRKDRLKLLDSGFDIFHISLAVDGFGKGITWAVFEDRRGGQRFISVSTHFWFKHNGPESEAIRELNVRHILWRVAGIRRKWGDIPVIVGGDLNSVPGTLAHETFKREGYRNAMDVAGEKTARSATRSYHGRLKQDEKGCYHGTVCPPGKDKPEQSIDHIFFTGGAHALRYDIDLDQETLDVSDHSPVIVDFTIQ